MPEYAPVADRYSLSAQDARNTIDFCYGFVNQNENRPLLAQLFASHALEIVSKYSKCVEPPTFITALKAVGLPHARQLEHLVDEGRLTSSEPTHRQRNEAVQVKDYVLGEIHNF